MKTLTTLGLVAACLAATASESSYTKSISWMSVINAKVYFSRIDETFTNVPQYNVDAEIDPPLSIAEAYRISQREFNRLREPQLRYKMNSFTLQSYGPANHWCYVFNYVVTGPYWKEIEPYKTQLLADSAAERQPPRISIVVLMDGTVVKPKETP